MADREELTIVVNVDDRASQTIAKIRNEFTALASGPSGASLAKFKEEVTGVGAAFTNLTKGEAGSSMVRFQRELVLVQNLSKGVGAEFAAVTRLLGPMGIAIGGVATAMTGFVLMLNKVASEMRGIQLQAQAFGMGAGALQSWQRQLKSAGIDADAAVRSLAGMSKTIYELNKPTGGTVRESLLSQASDPAKMLRVIETFKSLRSEEERRNYIIRQADYARDQAFKKTGDAMYAEEHRRRLLAEFGIDAADAQLKHIEKQSEAQAAADQARFENAQQFAELMGRINKQFGILLTRVATSNAFMGDDSPLVRSLTDAKVTIEKINKLVDDPSIEHFLEAGQQGAKTVRRATPPRMGAPFMALEYLFKFLKDKIPHFQDGGIVTGPGGEGADATFGPPSLKENNKELKENTDQLKKLNDVLALLEQGDIDARGLGRGGRGGAGMGAGGTPGGGSSAPGSTATPGGSSSTGNSGTTAPNTSSDGSARPQAAEIPPSAGGAAERKLFGDMPAGIMGGPGGRGHGALDVPNLDALTKGAPSSGVLGGEGMGGAAAWGGPPGATTNTDHPTASTPTTATSGGPPAGPQSQANEQPAAGGDARLTQVGDYKLGGDQRRAQLIQAANEASKNLPPGWRVEAFSGQREGGKPPHRTQAAVDFRLIDPNGHSVPDYQDPKSFAVYERFAQDSHLALQKINPALAQQHRWGGYFSGTLGKTYGAMDLMHQDVGGGNAQMAAGQWETGLHPAWRQAWGVGDASSGIGSRSKANEQAAAAPNAKAAAERQALNERAVNSVKVDVSGKLKANINAPKGTDVTLEGGGAFRKTELNRTTPMTEGGPR